MAWRVFVFACCLLAVTLADTTGTLDKKAEASFKGTEPATKLVNNVTTNHIKTMTKRSQPVDKIQKIEDNKPKITKEKHDKLDDEAKNKDALYYIGPYEGTCADNGIYYKSEFSFIVCNHAIHYTQPCPSGTKNKNISEFKPHTFYVISPFCSVNLNDYGYTVSKSGSLDKYSMKNKRTGGPLIPVSDVHSTKLSKESKIAMHVKNIKGIVVKHADYKMYRVPIKQAPEKVVEYIPGVTDLQRKEPKPAARRHADQGKVLKKRPELVDRTQSIKRPQPTPRPRHMKRPPAASRRRPNERSPLAKKSKPIKRPHSERMQQFERPPPRHENSFEDNYPLRKDYYDRSIDDNEEFSNEWTLPSHEVYSREYVDRGPHSYMASHQYRDYISREDIEGLPRRSQRPEQGGSFGRSREVKYYPETRPYHSTHHQRGSLNQSGELFFSTEHDSKRKPLAKLAASARKPNARRPFNSSPPIKHLDFNRNKNGYHLRVYQKWKDSQEEQHGRKDPFSNSFLEGETSHSYLESSSREWPSLKEYGKWTDPKGFYSQEMMSSKEMKELYPKDFFDSDSYKKEIQEMYPKHFFDKNIYKQGSASRMDFGNNRWKGDSQPKDNYVYPAFKGKSFITSPSLTSFERNLFKKHTVSKDFFKYPFTKHPFGKQPFQGRKNKKRIQAQPRDVPPFQKSASVQRQPPSFRDSLKWSGFPKEPFQSSKSDLTGGKTVNGLKKERAQENGRWYASLGKKNWRSTSPSSLIRSRGISSHISHSAKNGYKSGNKKFNAKATQQGNKNGNLVKNVPSYLHGRNVKGDSKFDVTLKDKVDWKDWLTDFKNTNSSDKRDPNNGHNYKEQDRSDKDNNYKYEYGYHFAKVPERTSASGQNKASQPDIIKPNLGNNHRFRSPESKKGARLGRPEGQLLVGNKGGTMSVENKPNNNFGKTQVSNRKNTWKKIKSKSTEGVGTKNYGISDFDLKQFDMKNYIFRPARGGEKLTTDGEQSADSEEEDVFENGRERLDIHTGLLHWGVKDGDGSLPEVITTPKYDVKKASVTGHKLVLTPI